MTDPRAASVLSNSRVENHDTVLGKRKNKISPKKKIIIIDKTEKIVAPYLVVQLNKKMHQTHEFFAFGCILTLGQPFDENANDELKNEQSEIAESLKNFNLETTKPIMRSIVKFPPVNNQHNQINQTIAKIIGNDIDHFFSLRSKVLKEFIMLSTLGFNLRIDPTEPFRVDAKTDTCNFSNLMIGLQKLLQNADYIFIIETHDEVDNTKQVIMNFVGENVHPPIHNIICPLNETEILKKINYFMKNIVPIVINEICEKLNIAS